MKLRLSNQRNQALTVFEVLIVIVCVAVLLMLIQSIFISNEVPRRAIRINCVSNIKQVNLALRLWEKDNQYPMGVSTNLGGGKESIRMGDVADCLRLASNQLTTPKILVCPADTSRIAATNFTSDFNNSHISYFLSPDATETYPQMVLDGDDNLAVNGVPVNSGITEITNCSAVTFTATRHIRVGNIGFADGSVSEVSALGLQNALQYATNGTPFATNRFAIP